MQRSRTLVTILALGLALAGLTAACNKETGKSSTSVPAGVEARLSKLEQRLQALITALEPRLGPAEPKPDQIYSVPIAAEDPVIGPADAKVTIVEGFEFACPHCAHAYPTVQKLIETYGQDLRVVAKYLVIHEQAIPAGLAACAARLQGKYPEMIDQIWAKVYGANDFNPATLDVIAASIPLDVPKFKTDMESPGCVSWLRGSSETLSTLGANATPAFFINGRFLAGNQPIELLKKVIDEEIAKADKATAGGVAKADYYRVAIVEKGLKKSQWDFQDDSAADAKAPAAPPAAQAASPK